MSDLPPPPPDDSGWSSQPPPPPGPPDAGGGAAPGMANLGTGESVQLASPGARLGARILDIVIVTVALVILAAIGVGAAFAGSSNSDDASAFSVGALVVSVLLAAAVGLLYEVTMIATRGQTLGKMATRIKVVRADNGLVPGWGKSIGRWIIPALLPIIPLVGWILSLLVYISLLWDRARQGWHDKAAGTLVVKV